MCRDVAHAFSTFSTFSALDSACLLNVSKKVHLLPRFCSFRKTESSKQNFLWHMTLAMSILLHELSFIFDKAKCTLLPMAHLNSNGPLSRTLTESDANLPSLLTKLCLVLCTPLPLHSPSLCLNLKHCPWVDAA